MQTLLWCVLIGIAASSNNLAAADEPDFRTQWATPTVWLFESPQIRQELDLTDQQSAQIDALINDWKAIVLKAQKDHETASESARSKRRTGRNRIPITSLRKAIGELLNDDQFQRFEQMRLLWNFSPVQFGDAIQFGELELSPDQLRELYALNIRWVLHGLAKLDCQFHFRRPEPKAAAVRRDFSGWRAYMENQTRLAWQFKSDRDAEWSRILTPAQARRWKELELQKTFGADPFNVLVTDYSSQVTGQIPQTGKATDYVVPYFTPPVTALGLSAESRQAIHALIAEFQDWKKPTPGNREEWAAWFKESVQRQVQFMQRIESTLSPEQRSTWWALAGEAGNQPFFKAWEASKE